MCRALESGYTAVHRALDVLPQYQCCMLDIDERVGRFIVGNVDFQQRTVGNFLLMQLMKEA